MKTNLLAVGLLTLCALVSGCTLDDSSRTGGKGGAAESAAQDGRTSAYTFAYETAGVASASRVDRRVFANGGEVLRGTKTVTVAGAAHPLVLDETAIIDASGKLVRATATLNAGPQAGDLVRSIQLDAADGQVTVTDAKGARAWRLPSDQPWIYEGLFADVAPEMADATAIQAWVARRAAQASERLRVVDVAGQSHHLTLPDQVAMADGQVDWIVLGDQVAEADADFVRALPRKALDAAADRCRAADLSVCPGPV